MAKPKAEQGDAEAMFIMYEVTSNKDWLEKSAEHDHAIAQYWMAIGIRQGEGFFLPWKRDNIVGEWLRKSAENGYPKAMMEYAVFYMKTAATYLMYGNGLKICRGRPGRRCKQLWGIFGSCAVKI